MKLAHVRERHAPAGSDWRLAAALDPGGGHWLDLEAARRRRVAADPRLAHSSSLFRRPVTTLDDHLQWGLRVEALADLVEGFEGRDEPDEDEAVLEASDLAFGPPILRPPSFRDFYAFERHVAAAWARRNSPIPESWYRIPVFYFSNVSEMRGPGDPVWAPKGCRELDYELEIAGLVDTPARDLPAETAEDVLGGYMILGDWSARDLQREETAVRLGPAKGKDFATSIGPWLVTPDEIRDRRTPGQHGFELAAWACVGDVETTRSTWAEIHYSFGEMLARASADVRLRPGDIIGSGTVGGGCLMEVKDERLGRWLEPGDDVVLAVERLGELRTPIVARPGDVGRRRPQAGRA